MIELIENFGIYAYAVAILFGGIWGVNFIPFAWKDKYKFAAFSTFIAVLFVAIEVLVSKNFQAADAVKYLITYTVVTSCYELFLKSFFDKIGIKKD